MTPSIVSTGRLDPVVAWLRAYEGSDNFIQSIKAAEQRYGLTDRQYAAAEKNMERLEDAAAEAYARSTVVLDLTKVPTEPTDGLDLTSLPKGTSYHALPNASGKLTFIRIDHVDKPGTWNGWVFVKQVIGGNPDERRGSQKPGGSYRGTFEDMLRDIVAQPNTTMATYGREIGCCARCNRHLTDETSRELGIGPECRKKGL